MFRRSAAAVLSVVLMGSVAACSSGPRVSNDSDKVITVYSGRNENLVKPLFEKFTAATGIRVEARYGESAAMAAQLLEEKDKSKADVFLAQDAGALGAVTKAGLLAALPTEVLQRVEETYRGSTGTWVGVTGRSRVLAYNPDEISEDELPASVLELTEPKWKGKVAIVPTNASFQAFVTALRLTKGEDAARSWLAGMKANEAPIRSANVELMQDINDGDVAAGLLNHYYWGELRNEIGADKMRAKLHFFRGGDPGGLVNVSGAGVLKAAAADREVRTFLDYLLGTEAQTYFAQETNEYPLVASIPTAEGFPSLAELDPPAVDLNDLSALQETIAMIKEAGLV